ncbi:uncharacterized protein K02A2.6-like [Armigeres subalbatus]|uniref:uncharacterized protein K02A2.6-like n=1 Tax=Armigeres subalbatus TaxID=124917 RepID=UPI002ED1D1BB
MSAAAKANAGNAVKEHSTHSAIKEWFRLHTWRSSFSSGKLDTLLLELMEESRPLPMFRCEQIEGGKLAKEWQEWRSSLEYYFESYQVTDQKMMRSKMLYLGGPQLQRVFNTLEGTEDFPLVLLEKRWYDVAVDRLDAYFKPRKQDVLERHRLRSMKQGSNERFSHYILRLRQQLRECGLEKYSQDVRSVMEEIMMIDVIVEGWSSQELRRKILEKDQSLYDIEVLGESLESVRIQEQELKTGKGNGEPGSSEVFKVQKELRTRKERREDRIGHMSKSPMCPAKDQSCRRCKKPGHFEIVCRKRPSDPHSWGPTKKVHIVEEKQEDTEDTMQPIHEPVLQPTPQPMPCRTAAERKVYYTFYTGNDANVLNFTIGGAKMDMFIDSGSDVNLITSEAWQKLKAQQVAVSKCESGSSKIIRAYASNTPLTVLGSFQAVIEIGKRSVEAEFLVIANGQRNLLGDMTSKQLGILKIGLGINRVVDDGNTHCPFSKIKDTKIRISMDPTITPVFQSLRRIPIPLEGAVNQKLEELLRRDIIEPKVGPASWVSPLVVANKANGNIRLCIDLRRVNQAVVRERHPMPVVDDILAKVGKGKVWSILDIKDAFFLLELEEESRDIVTFITHRGLYRFKRLPFGLVSPPEIFQRKMDEMLADCEGTYWYMDDVGVEGSSVEEHDLRLKKVYY